MPTSRQCPGPGRAASLLFALLLTMTADLAAHDFSIVEVRLAVNDSPPTSHLQFLAELIVDLDALLLGVGPGHDPVDLLAAIDHLSPEERRERERRLRQIFERRVRVLADGEPTPFAIEFAQASASAWAAEFELDQPSRLGVVAQLRGVLPEGTKSVGTRLSRAFGASRLVVDYQRARSPPQLVPPGTDSVPVVLGELEAAGSRSAVAWRYTVLGFTHILPLGLDHLLFIFGLCLVPRGRRREDRPPSPAAREGASLFAWRPSLRSLLLLVTVFTLAHATTLALSMLRDWSVPTHIVEPMIAASILGVAADAFWPRRSRRFARALVVFAFGLLHGLGFASVLFELGLPAGRRGLALVTFHLGVEVAQLLVVLTAVAVLWPWASRSWYERRLARPLAVVIALTATAWLVQRTVL